MAGLFSILSVGVSGLTTQQTAINVTAHNIANANTDGYSRQRALMEATNPLGGIGLNSPTGPGQLGTGSQVSAIQRVRDSFLDYQIRSGNSTQGNYTARQQYLGEVEGVFSEPSETGFSNALKSFYDSWSNLTLKAGSPEARTMVAEQSNTLANQLNSTYTQLQDIKTNMNSAIAQNVLDSNSVISQVDKLNQQIIIVKVSGSEPNDLMDKRDKLLDTLSTKFGITIDNKDFYGQNVTPIVQTGSVNPLDPAIVKAIDPTNVKKFSYINSIKPGATAGTYDIEYYKNGDVTNKVTINITATTAQAKQLSETRVLWADKDGNAIKSDGSLTPSTGSFSDLTLFIPASGELNGLMSTQTDADAYIDQINNFAKALAFSVNALHSGVTNPTVPTGAVPTPPTAPTTDFMPFFVNADAAVYQPDHTIALGTDLDNVLSQESQITAGNISVNQTILNDPSQIKTKTNDDLFAYAKGNNIDGSDDEKRAQLIADLRNTMMNIGSIGLTINSRKDFFDPTLGGNSLNKLNFQGNTQGMTLDNYFKDTVNKLAVASQEAQRIVKGQQLVLDAYTQTKESVSGVNMDEEMANMVQQQHAYSANAKIISTVDQLLDVVINGLKK